MCITSLYGIHHDTFAEVSQSGVFRTLPNLDKNSDPTVASAVELWVWERDEGRRLQFLRSPPGTFALKAKNRHLCDQVFY